MAATPGHEPGHQNHGRDTEVTSRGNNKRQWRPSTRQRRYGRQFWAAVRPQMPGSLDQNLEDYRTLGSLIFVIREGFELASLYFFFPKKIGET